MIQGNLRHIDRYFGVHPLLGKAITFFIENRDHLQEGKNVVDEDIYIVKTTTPLRRAQEAPLEAHDRYIDVQILLSDGVESFGVADRAVLTAPRGEMDRENDILFFDDPASYVVTNKKDDFVIFFPEDAHAPLIGEGEVVKAIIKIKTID